MYDWYAMFISQNCLQGLEEPVLFNARGWVKLYHLAVTIAFCFSILAVLLSKKEPLDTWSFWYMKPFRLYFEHSP